MIRALRDSREWIAKIALFGAVIGMIVLWMMAINRTGELYLSGIEVQVDQKDGIRDLITAKDVKRLVEKGLPNDVIMQPIKRIDVPSIEDMLRVDTRVMEAQVYVDAHQKLIIDVEQRRPIARVINSRNDQFYMDRNGRYIQISDHRAVRVPVVTGYVESLKAGESSASKPRLKETLSILHLIRKDEFLTALIEQIHVESTHRIILIPKVGDERIILDHL
ncbi:MAG: hypothetical protein AAFR14_11370, partial [Bacteroidota bacterium]